MTAFSHLWDHLWQSTLVAVLIFLLIPLFRNNSARIRYGLWLAASLKFLVPFFLIATLGRMVFVQTIPTDSMAVVTRVRSVAEPFSIASPVAVAERFPWLPILLGMWLLGAVCIFAVWIARWHGLQAAVRAARPLAFDLPIPVKSANRMQEPGLVGILRPVILLPEGIIDRLSRTEIDAILTHELCHLRRRDNLVAALHMFVSCIFWFHPLVWYIGGRLIEERERACDEEVLEGEGNPLDYAQTILKVCRLYLRSALPCASGVSGADLDRRITAIMARKELSELDCGRKALLTTLLAVSVIAPFATGGLKPAPVAELGRRLASVLVPPAPNGERHALQVIKLPPHNANRHRARRSASQGSMEIHHADLVPPAIKVAPSFIFATAPQLDTSQPVATDDLERKVCRPPQQLPDSRLFGPQVCLSKIEWDRIREHGLVLMPDGRTLVASFEKQNSLKGRTCSYAGVSASTVGSWPVICF